MSARAALVDLLQELERAGTTMTALVRGGCGREPWRLFPGEYGVFDRRTRSQFYYHSHEDTEHEDGHFHTVRFFADHTVHLVAISMAPDGWPRTLFHPQPLGHRRPL